MKMKWTYALPITLGLTLMTHPLFAVARAVTLNPAKSTITWVGKKVTGQHDGTIQLKSGHVTLDGSQVSGGTFEVDMNSLAVTDIQDAGMNAKLVGHLKSDDFFSVDKHPTSTFVIKSVTPQAGAQGTHEISGDLTIKGKTAPLTFPATVVIDKKSVKADATITVDRTVYDIRYGSKKFFDKIGDKAIHDTFTLTVHLEGAR